MKNVRSNMTILFLIASIAIMAFMNHVSAASKGQQVTTQKLIKSIQVNMKQLDIYQGEKVLLSKYIKTTAVYSDGTKKDISGQVKYAYSNASQVAFSSGTVQGVNPGTSTLTVSFGTMKTSIRLNVKVVPVVLIPGTMGSNLVDHDTGKKLWISISQSDVERLILPSNGEIPMAGQSGSNIRASSILDDGSLLPQLDFYSPVEYHLKAAGYQVETFPYDWRLDIDRNAERLGELLKLLAKKYNTDKFHMIAHSQGGLIANRFLQRSMKPIPGSANVNPGKVKPGKLILVAVPQAGTPVVFNSCCGGKVAGLDSPLVKQFISLDTIKKVIQNSPAFYQMFPSNKYFSLYAANGIDASKFQSGTSEGKSESDYKTMDAWINGSTSINMQLYNRFIRFYDGNNGLDSFDLLNQDTAKYVEGYVIAGTGINTVASYANGEYFYLTGDGTVPVLSATGGRLSGAKIKYIANVDHGSLIKDKRAINEILNILSDKSVDAEGILKSPGELKKIK